MHWKVLLFETSRGEKPVERFLKSLEPKTTAKVIHEIDLLSMYGHHLGMPHVKKLSSQLYELRTRGRQEVRILFTVLNNQIYLLHGFKKKTRKTPPKELSIALKRLEAITT